MIDAIDLFCGAGGLTAGLIRSGVKVKAGYDINLACKYAFETNNKAPFMHQDVKDASRDDICAFFEKGNIRLLAGCAPCQPFSSYSHGKNVLNDTRWPLLYEFSRLILEIKPELVTMENVPNVAKHKVYNDFINTLFTNGYSVWADTINCADYGVPQQRKRHVLMASRLGEISLMPPTHKNSHLTVRDTISYLSKIQSGGVDPVDSLHRSVLLSEINRERIAASVPGGSWSDWPKDLLLNCHKNEVGKRYVGVYGRMEWDKPSPTMTTYCHGFGNGRFGHPEQDRAISLREAALLQTFPPGYIFCQNKDITFKEVGKMIGNAVPVRIGEVIGQSFNQHLLELIK